MSFYSNIKQVDPATVQKVIKKIGERKCPYCSTTYIIGRDGVVDGCDRCVGIVRNADGMIVAAANEQDLPGSN
jgi:hypothetical protein